jgi:hypothetical protein
MRIVLLAAAAAVLTLTAAPAQAEATGFRGHSSSSFNGVAVHRIFERGHGDGNHQDRHRHRNSRGDAFFAGSYDSDYDQNRSWEPDSYNDWWHDRPDRAFPRWMTHNQNCERLWWSGGDWRC